MCIDTAPASNCRLPVARTERVHAAYGCVAVLTGRSGFRFARCAAGALAGRLSAGPRGDRAPRLLSLCGRPDRAVDGGREPDEMAPRPCDLVFRAILARAASARLHDLRRAFSVPVQFLLRGGRPAPRAS